MTTHFTDLAQRAAADGAISPEELLSLRREGWGDGIISQPEAEALFAINNVLTERDDAWCDFFVEAIGEFVLNGTEPRRQCSDKEADWLIAQVDHDGVVESIVELETLVRIIERAENVPDRLKNYVLDQIEREVLHGTGPTRDGGELSDTHINATECKLIRRVIFGAGGHGSAAVSRFDAEMLFRLKDATLGHDNAEEWSDLFVDGIANFLRGFTLDNAQVSHARKLELEAFVADNRVNRAAFFGRMIREARNIGDNVGLAQQAVGPQNDYYADAAKGDEVTDHEQAWLDAKIEQDGELDALERCLIKRLLED